MYLIYTLRPRLNGRRFADDQFKCIFLNENARIAIKIPLKFVSKGPINNIPSLINIMDWHRPGDKPSSEIIMVRLPMHIYITGPQWVKRGSTVHQYKSETRFSTSSMATYTWREIQYLISIYLKRGLFLYQWQYISGKRSSILSILVCIRKEVLYVPSVYYLKRGSVLHQW